MIHHVSLGVTDISRSAEFYRATLQTLGYRIVCRDDNFVGFGVRDNEDPFYITYRADARASEGSHIAFRATTRECVDAFHRAGLEQGGLSNGGPGLRESYAPDYYAAFLLDPDGHRIEAVCC